MDEIVAISNLLKSQAKLVSSLLKSGVSTIISNTSVTDTKENNIMNIRIYFNNYLYD